MAIDTIYAGVYSCIREDGSVYNCDGGGFMNLRLLIPRALLDHITLIKKKMQFPHCQISTHKISNLVKLGNGSSVGIDADLRDDVEIGDYSYVSPGTIIASGTIGNYCSIGYRCQIGMFEHPTNHLSTSPYIYNKNRSVLKIDTWNEVSSPPVIGNDVWIGSNAIILQGVAIGDGAVIAAGAVVTKDVARYTIVGGVPAKVIRKRFTDEQIQKLNEFRWWEMPLEELEKHKNVFEAKERWAEQIET